MVEAGAVTLVIALMVGEVVVVFVVILGAEVVAVLLMVVVGGEAGLFADWGEFLFTVVGSIGTSPSEDWC